ncbi:MAG: 3-isopropylmalate dehydratase large subunit [Promethearchaeota archaeon]|nr:MAG: 3-isopropylmalate dehydratase large subunit [Candidatus Lokiarchaeota archaeon]
MSMTQQILGNHIVEKDTRKPRIPEIGEIIDVEIDITMVHEQLGGRIAPEYKKLELDYVKYPERIVYLLDHWVPSPSVPAANMHNRANQFARRYNFKHILGENKGICHTVLPEQGYIYPGMVAIGSDSHSTTYGAYNCFSTGVGATDVCIVFATGKLWFKVPESLNFSISSAFQKGVYAKDLALYILQKHGTEEFIYRSLEYTGTGLKNLSMESRHTVANMCAEMGGKNAIFESDKITEQWFRNNFHFTARHGTHIHPVSPEPSAEYNFIEEINLAEIRPLIAKPYSPDNVVEVNECIGTELTQGFIGSCTNGSLEDLRIAAKILKGHTIHPNNRCIVIPASTEIYLNAMKEGLIEIFLKAGCIVGPSTCGPCFGGHMGILGDEDVCISTTNRNYRGRMGSYDAEAYLASPATVAASVIHGKITSPLDYSEVL